MLTRPGVTRAPPRSSRPRPTARRLPPTSATRPSRTSTQPSACSLPSIVHRDDVAAAQQQLTHPATPDGSRAGRPRSGARTARSPRTPRWWPRRDSSCRCAGRRPARRSPRRPGPRSGNSISSPSGTYWSSASPRPSIASRALGRAARGHAAVDLVEAAAPAHDVAGALRCAGQQAADHHGARRRRRSPWRGRRAAGCRRRRSSARRSRAPRLAQSSTAVSCGTPTPATSRVVQAKPGPDADLDRVGARRGEVAHALGGRDVARDELGLGEAALELAHGLQRGIRRGRGRCPARARRASASSSASARSR